MANNYKDIIKRNQNDNDKFSEQVDKFLAGEMKIFETLSLGATPNVLHLVGAKAKELTIRQNVLQNAFFDETQHRNGHSQGHDIPIDTIKQLPDALRNPIVVFRGQHPQTVVVLTSLKNKEDENIIVPIALDLRSANSTVNKVTSVYGKTSLTNYLRKHEKDIIAINIKKADELFTTIGYRLSQTTSTICFDDSIAYSTENVNTQNNIKLPITGGDTMSDIAQMTKQEFNELPLDELLEKLSAAHDIIVTRDNLEQYTIEQIENKNIVGAADVLNIMMQSDAEYFRIDKLTPTPIIDKYDIADIIDFKDEAELTYDTRVLEQLADYENRYFISPVHRLTVEAKGNVMLKTDVKYHDAELKLKGYQQREATEVLYGDDKHYPIVQCISSKYGDIPPNAFFTLYEFNQRLKALHEKAYSEKDQYDVKFMVLPPIDEDAPIYESKYPVGTSHFKGLANHIVQEAQIFARLVTSPEYMARYNTEDAQYLKHRSEEALTASDSIQLNIMIQGIYTENVYPLKNKASELRQTYEPVVFFDNKHSENYEAEVRKIIFAKHFGEKKWSSSAEIPQETVNDYIRTDDKSEWQQMHRNITALLNEAPCVCLGNTQTNGVTNVKSIIANDFNELKVLWQDCDYVKVYDNEGELHIESGRGNTVNRFELRLLNDNAADYIQMTENEPELKVHQALFLDDNFTRKPMLAQRVYGSPIIERQHKPKKE